MSDFLQRVHDAKARYTAKTGDWPDQLFLGPKEYNEFKEMCAKNWGLRKPNIGDLEWLDSSKASVAEECAGMTIIGLMSDGLRAGRTVE